MSVETGRLPHLSIGLLGLVTIAAYGTWYYAFGVLLEPLLVDTGWSEGTMAAVFGVSMAAGALLGLPAGRYVDRVGCRRAFLLAAVGSTAGLLPASLAATPLLFALCAVPGAAALQALAFYHVSQSTAVRIAPERSARAIAVLTVYGALASMIYLPLAAALVERIGWRATLRVLVLITAAVLVVAAVGIRDRPDAAAAVRRGPGAVSQVLATSAARRYAVAVALVGLAVGTVLLYQVPVMVGAGLSAGAAAWLAGARGVAQVTGRIPLGWMLDRMEARQAVRLAFAAIAVGIALVAFAGNLVVAAAYTLVAGFGIGATSPLMGIYADELFDRSSLGESMGLITMIFGLSTAFGPALVGVLAEVTGSRRWGLGIAVVAALAAVAAMGPPGSDRRPSLG
ncbi:MAG: MFS transporter [Actinomycetota bacterium]